MKNKIITILLALLVLSIFGHAQTIATVNNRNISQAEIDATITSQLLPLEQQIYALRLSALENYITRLVLEDEAQRRGVTLDALKKQLTNIKVEINPAEVERSYAENAPAFAQMSPEEAKERIRLDMETQGRMRAYREAVNKLRQQRTISLKLKEPLLPVAVNEGGERAGNENAAVTIVEFADFNCGYCQQVLPAVKNCSPNTATGLNSFISICP